MLFKGEEVRICKECKWYKRNELSGLAALNPSKFRHGCMHEDIATVDYVTGEIVGRVCEYARSPSCKCGIGGALFEPKEGADAKE